MIGRKKSNRPEGEHGRGWGHYQLFKDCEIECSYCGKYQGYGDGWDDFWMVWTSKGEKVYICPNCMVKVFDKVLKRRK